MQLEWDTKVYCACVVMFVFTYSLACSSCGSGSRASGMILGIVRDGNNKPVNGAVVAAIAEPIIQRREVSPPAALTHSRADGSYRLVNLPAGEYVATVSAPNVASSSRSGLSIREGGTISGIDFALPHGGVTFSGIVTDSRGMPISMASVRALRLRKESFDVFVAEESPGGQYSLTVSEGWYTIIAQSDGYLPEMKRIALFSNSSVDFRLDSVTNLRSAAPRSVGDWIRKAAVPLPKSAANPSSYDFSPLLTMVGDSRLVGIGESTHGTHEFFDLKRSALEFLVNEMGFNVLGIEANFAEVTLLNNSLSGSSDGMSPLAQVRYWMWDSEEGRSVIEWIRAYNMRHTVKVKVYGIDPQPVDSLVRYVVRYIRQVDSLYASRVERSVSALALQSGYGQASEEIIRATRKAISDLSDRMVRRKSQYVERSSLSEWETVRQMVDLLGAAEAGMESRDASYVIRDQSMAETVRWILKREGPRSKMLVWAHNSHIALDGDGAMGSQLRRELGNSIFTLGLFFDRGTFLAVPVPEHERDKGLEVFSVGPAPEGSLEALLRGAGLPVSLIDLRAVPKETQTFEWMNTRHPVRHIGAGYNGQNPEDYYENIAPGREFDALIFVDQVSPLRQNGPPGIRGNASISKDAWPVQESPTNLDFEDVDNAGIPRGWFQPRWSEAAGYRIFVGTQDAKRVRQFAGVGHSGRPTPGTFGNLMQRFQADNYRGKRVRFRAAARIQPLLPESRTQLWLRIDDGNGKVLFFDNMDDRPIVSNLWKDYEILADVSEEAKTIQIGIILKGPGQAFVEDASFEVVAKATH